MAEISKVSMKRSKPSYFFSILGVAALLILIGILGWILINGSKLEHHFRGSVQVQIYLKENAIQRDVDSFKTYVSSQPYSVNVEYVSKEQAKERFLKDGNEGWDKVLDYNPLPASIEFYLKPDYVNKDTLTQITADLQQNALAKEIHYPSEVVSNLNLVRKVGWVLIVIVSLLAILVILLIDNTIKLAMFSNRFLIKTMQMVGATRWFISKPFDAKAVINGLWSSIIAIVVIQLIIFGVEKWVPDFKALRDYTLLGSLFLGIILIGIGITFISTHRSVIKYLKMKLDDLY